MEDIERAKGRPRTETLWIPLSFKKLTIFPWRKLGEFKKPTKK